MIKYPPWNFALMCKMPPKLENLYFFFIIDSKDIKGKLLTIIDHINLYGMYVYVAIGHINLYGRYVTLICFKYIIYRRLFLHKLVIMLEYALIKYTSI